MPEGYLHLTCEQRCQIYALLQSGRSQAHIARQIGVDPSTISRELVRNTGARGYRFKQAHEKASQRRQEASDKPRKMTPDLVELIEEKLTQEQWSPDQISGRLAKDGVAFISHERIYQHVWKDKKDGGTLYLHLRHSGKKYNRRKGKNSGRGLIPNRVDIDQRPPIVAAKSRIGDWEADTTSQKVPTSLFCPMPMSKGSRTNSTLAPERYSATKPLARFSSAPEICPLHFTVEWANGIRSSVTGRGVSIPFLHRPVAGSRFCPGSAHGRHLMGSKRTRSANLDQRF